MYTTFGAILKDLRTSRNLTQEDLAKKTNYSKDTIRGVENDRLNPSTTLINKLSYIFNIDLNRYFYAIENDFPFLLQDTFQEFRNAIEVTDVAKLEELLNKYEGSPIYENNKGLELIYYAKAICEYSKNKCKAFDYINLALKLNGLSLDNLNLDYQVYSITTYNILGYLSVLYYSISEFTISEQIINDLYLNLKRNFFSDTKMLNYNLSKTIRLYIILLNNLSTIELNKNNTTNALNYINEAIEICIENYTPKLLHNLYFTKFECFYNLENFNEATFTFEQVLMFCSIIDIKYVNIYLEKLETKFPKILDFLDVNISRKKYNVQKP